MHTSPEKFSPQVLDLLEDSQNELLLSAASSWEIAIKYALGKLKLPVPPQRYVPDRIQTSGVSPLAIEHGDALHVTTLPPHHRDPFDRMLIAQAQLRQISILTSDAQFKSYKVNLIWA